MSPDDCIAAEEGGADRIELVSAIELGGLTPSFGAFLAAKRVCKLPLMVMLRPRTGGFCYTKGEFETMVEDARCFTSSGADGLVAGILTRDGQVDEGRCRTLLEAVDRSVEWVFHRAFDITPDPIAALRSLMAIGFRRVLTSGQKATALEGAELIRQLVEVADGRIEVLPGSGVNAANAARLTAITGVGQIHVTAWADAEDPSTRNASIRFNGREALEAGFRTTLRERVAETRLSLKATK
jgi:copper homeostasis protein